MDTIGSFCLLAILSTLMIYPEAEECQKFIALKEKTVLQSPNFPFHYPPNMCILWFYSGEANYEFVLRILDLDLPGKMGACSHSNDVLMMIGPAQKNILCGKLRKALQPEYRVRLTEQRKRVYIIFNSTSNPQKGTGFRAEYFIRKYNYSSTPVVTSTVQPSNDKDQESKLTTQPWSWNRQIPRQCYYRLTSTSSGHIPQNVINETTVHECLGSMTWLVVAPKPKIPLSNAARIFEVDVKSCPRQLMNPQDLLEVFDGRNVSMPLLISCSKYGRNVIGSHSTNTDSFFVQYKLQHSSSRDLFGLRFRMKAQCFQGFVSCGDEDACYHPSGRCNGTRECSLRGRDELNCGSTQCPLGKYSCDMNSQHCYEEKDRCNGRGTCTNYKDEMNCDPSNCNPKKGLFLCNNSRCIYEKWRCDGTSDCADNSDESGCGSLMTPRVIVAAVVGSLICSLLLVVALGCARKLFRLPRLQSSGGTSPGGSCCAAHGRHDSPLTRQLAEMFRQRAPPPPYHEAMLTSRPYHEMLRELVDERPGNTSIENARELVRDGVGLFRPLRRRESDPGSSGVVCTSQRQSSRRSRGRRQHREVNQHGPSFHTADNRNTGFIEVGSLTLLCGGLAQEESNEDHQGGNIEPPPYSVSDPVNAGSLEATETAGFSSGENNSEDSDDGIVEREEGMHLRRQRKARRSRSSCLEGRAAVPSSGVPCLEMSQDTWRRDHRVQISSSQSVHLQRSTLLPREVNGDDCNRIDEENYKRENETPHASLSIRSSHGLEPSMSFQRDNQECEHVLRLVEEDSDSDCILMGEDNADDKDKEEDNLNEKDEEMDPIFEEDSDDSDTACLLSTV
ncbi:hypothetical protein RRG08_028813 [Elysia crispata]|uniref:CUB domain-containing protein n=1 Tax=Elysia crispata TaxID=231223 RepID=A0AAE0XUB9_9GAST|nr:hypothetical protein RRG08_028813 [Elysia crispata]